MDVIQFDHLLLSKSFTDFRLRVHDKEYRLHKAILFSRSGYFHSFFLNDPTARYHEINDNEIDAQSVDIMLQWLYSSKDFHFEKSNFSSIVRAAVFFEVNSLLDCLQNWMGTNYGFHGSLELYVSLLNLRGKLSEQFYKIILDTVVENFLKISLKELAHVPYMYFVDFLNAVSRKASYYYQSEAISEFLISKNQGDLSELYNRYLKLGFPTSIDKLLVLEDSPDSLIHFTARNFHRLTRKELSSIPFEKLLQILESSELFSPNQEIFMKQIDELSYNPVFKKFKDRSFNFPNLSLTPNTVRILIAGSVYYDVLDTVKKLIHLVGIPLENIAVVNADIETPTKESLYKFDVVFTFTHYQFSNSIIFSRNLESFVSHGGALVCAYGFFRSDEWGCNQKGHLIQYLPTTFGETLDQANDSSIICNNKCPMMDGIDRFEVGSVAPRSNVSIKEGAKLISSYSDGIPLVTAMPTKCGKYVVGLNASPVSKSVHHFGFEEDQPAALLFGRACLYSAGITIS